MINQIYSEEIKGEQIIYLPIIKTNKIILICCTIFTILFFIFLLYTSYKNGSIKIVGKFGLIGGIGSLLGAIFSKKCSHPKFKSKVIIMGRNQSDNSLIIKNDNKTIKKPFENIKCFSNLKENGKGIYLELIQGDAIKIESYEYEDSIIERAVLEFNKCFDKLLIKQSLIASVL